MKQVVLGALAALSAVTFALVMAGCEEMKPTPSDERGTLKVSSEPQGARVFLDGEDTGKQTPATFRVSSGSHTIRLTREGWSEWGPHRFRVTAGETTRVDATLSPVPDADPQALGLEPLPQEIYEKLPVLAAEPVATPGTIDLSPDFPRPRSQGLQGSCVGWAVAYALKSYHERVERGWSLTDNAHLMSPAYVYNQAKAPGGNLVGTYIPDALNLLVDQGVSSLALMPYDSRDYLTQPNAAARAEAANYKIAVWGRVDNSGPRAEFEQEMKRHLAAGRPIVIGVPVYPEFHLLNESNPVYDDSSGMREGGHAIVVVGYDDSKRAFRILNSWGDDWGIDGYGWIHYDFIDTLVRSAYVTVDETGDATVARPTPATQPVPRDASTGVASNTKLAWTRGDHTTSFDVYLGTDPELGALEFRGNTEVAEFQASLESDTRYYWRIDSRSDTGITRGPVWSFTTVSDDDQFGKSWAVARSPVGEMDYLDVAWSGTRFVAVGVNRGEDGSGSDDDQHAIIYSDDGVTWREAILPADIFPYSVAWAGGRFFAIGSGHSHVISSTDGATWRVATIDLPQHLISGVAFDWTWISSDVAWNGERFVILTIFGSYHSNDGITWSEATDWEFLSDPAYVSLGLAWNGQRFVGVGRGERPGFQGGVILHSSDGILWSEAHLRSSSLFTGVAWNGDRFVSIGVDVSNDLRTSDGVIMYSSDGITWSEAVTDSSFVPFGLTWTGEHFVASGFESVGGAIHYSRDGRNWTSDGTTHSFVLSAIAGSTSRLVAVGLNGMILYSQ